MGQVDGLVILHTAIERVRCVYRTYFGAESAYRAIFRNVLSFPFDMHGIITRFSIDTGDRSGSDNFDPGIAAYPFEIYFQSTVRGTELGKVLIGTYHLAAEVGFLLDQPDPAPGLGRFNGRGNAADASSDDKYRSFSPTRHIHTGILIRPDQ
jgi:hypothetical protein